MSPTVRGAMTAETCFLLNDRAVTTTARPGLLVLDYLRRRERRTGTKEGCKEGDCGACTVLIGELEGDRIHYKPVTSCLMPVAELEGKHLVTIEGLRLPQLSTVQQAIVDQGATQCGFCTPGIVVSMTGLLMQEGARVDDETVQAALSGHLCRCTGYRSLRAAGEVIRQQAGERTGVEALVADGVLPAYFRDAAARLLEIQRRDRATLAPANNGSPTLIGGGTDLYVQRGEEIAATAAAEALELRPRLKGIERRDDVLKVGAMTTFEDFAAHREVQARIPNIRDYMFLIASWQIRNRATLGGNVINASPIGDMTILLLALRCQLVLEAADQRRTVAMSSFYKGYKVLDKAPEEVLTEILIPVAAPDSQVGWEKVSKRKTLDIATVNSAIEIRATDGVVADVCLAVGGVAPIPLQLEATGEYLLGQPVEPTTVERALAIAQTEISPISDVRGSADYKRLLTRQLLIGHFTGLFPDRLRVDDFHAEPS